MSIVGDLVQGVVDSALKEILKKTTGTGKRVRRRKRAAAGASGTLRRQIEELLKPHKKQVSRRKTAQTRSKAQQRRVTAKTQAHKRSLRRGATQRSS
jgi:hypothetical protein